MNRFLVFAVLLAACHHPSDAGPVSFAPTLSTRELWSGGTATLTEPYFATLEPVVELGGDTIGVTRLDDSTFLLHLPRTAGTFPLRVIAGEQAASLGDVTVHGFHDFRMGPFMSGQPYWLPGGAPRVFAGANTGAAIIDLRTLTAAYSVPDSISTPDCIWSPSPTHRSDRFVMMGKRPGNQCGPAILWSLTEPPQALDSIACCSTNWYTTGQPSPGRWTFNWNNHNYWYLCDSTCLFKTFDTSDGPNGVTISPKADRFLWLPADRPVVYDARSLDTAYVLPGLCCLQGAFSFEGDTLALIAHDDTAYQRIHVLLVRASDGTILRDMRVDTLLHGQEDRLPWPGPVAFDPTRPWLYAAVMVLASGDSISRPSVMVIDRTNWTLLGVIDTPAPTPFVYQAMVIVPDPVEHFVYIVSTANGYNIHLTPGLIFRYSTP